MKLYATVQSERASKGQGGEWLDIEIKDAYKDIIGIIKVRVRDDETGDFYSFEISHAEHIYIKKNIMKAKGEKKKGEVKQVKVKNEHMFTTGNDWHD